MSADSLSLPTVQAKGCQSQLWEQLLSSRTRSTTLPLETAERRPAPVKDEEQWRQVLGHAPPSTGPELEEREMGILIALCQHAAATG
jgi:hypothetical protein